MHFTSLWNFTLYNIVGIYLIGKEQQFLFNEIIFQVNSNVTDFFYNETWKTF